MPWGLTWRRGRLALVRLGGVGCAEAGAVEEVEDLLVGGFDLGSGFEEVVGVYGVEGAGWGFGEAGYVDGSDDPEDFGGDLAGVGDGGQAAGLAGGCEAFEEGAGLGAEGGVVAEEEAGGEVGFAEAADGLGVAGGGKVEEGEGAEGGEVAQGAVECGDEAGGGEKIVVGLLGVGGELGGKVGGAPVEVCDVRALRLNG